MELGQLLKQTRLEAGLSQRQLCGEKITRNMLSQIENGSAKPSMDTLRYLAGQLGKPISFFLQEDAASPNQAALSQAREAWKKGDTGNAIALLEDFPPDENLAAEAQLLLLLSYLSAAEKALADSHIPYAHTLLEKAGCCQTPYYTDELERKRLLLLAKISPEYCLQAAEKFSDDELLLRANAAYLSGDFPRCAVLLDCAASHSQAWNILRGDVCFALEDYAQARTHYLQAEPQCLRKLELCCEKLGDYKMAYYYACKQR